MDQLNILKKENYFISFFKKNKDKIVSFLFIFLILFYALNVAYNRAAFVDFYAIDGDFQSYNAWRRLIHGYIPFKDFSVYLGSGHLYIGSLFTLLFGGSFSSSLVTGVFLTIVFTAIIIFTITKLITSKTNFALFTSALFLIGYSINPSIFNLIIHNIFHVNQSYLTPGPSARVIRGFCIIIYVIIAYFLVKKIYYKNLLFFSICASSLCSLLIMYSNDSGVAGYISASICYFIILIIRFKKNFAKIFGYVVLWIGCTIVSWLMLLLLITHGNITNYFEAIFGTSGAQAWYYQITPNRYIFSISDIFKNIKFSNFIIFIYIILEFILLIKNRNSKKIWFHFGLVFIYLSYFIDYWIYALISAPTKNELLCLVFFASSFGYIFELFRIIKYNSINFEIKNKRNFGPVLYSIFIGILMVNQIIYSKNIFDVYSNRSKNGEYFKQLGGYLSNEGTELYAGSPGVTSERMDDLNRKVRGKHFFSTYSSAMEVVNNKFAPVREDYIIHTLGQKEQNEYLSTFKKENFDIVLTPSIKNSLGYYEWIVNSNWFFFKYVYEHYHYLGTYGYAEVWQKDDKDRIVKIESSINQQKVNSELISGVKDVTAITIKTKKKVDAIANVKIKYKVTDQIFGTIKSNIGIIPLLPTSIQSKVEVPYFNLPTEGEYEIPIYLKDGEGSSFVFPLPQNKSNLEIENLRITKIIKNDFRNIVEQ